MEIRGKKILAKPFWMTRSYEKKGVVYVARVFATDGADNCVVDITEQELAQIMGSFEFAGLSDEPFVISVCNARPDTNF